MSRHVVRRLLLALFCFITVFGDVGHGYQNARAGESKDLFSKSFSSEENQPVCWPLDVIMLVDQSQSMWNSYPQTADSKSLYPPNDPLNYRYYAVLEVLDRLILNRQEECPLAIHRLGLITYGSYTTVVLPLVQIDLRSTDDGDLWSADLRRRILEAANDRLQQGTDPKIAFEAAEKLFKEAPIVNDPEEYGPRRRVTVLLTDGNPQAVGELGPYMCGLIDYLNSDAWIDSSIWLVPLNASDGPYLDRRGCPRNANMRGDWQDIIYYEGRPRQGRIGNETYSEQTIPAFVSDIVNTEFGHPGEVLRCGETFYLEAYLQGVEFTFFRSVDDPNLVVTLSKVDDATNSIIYQVQRGEVLRDLLPQSSQMRLVDYDQRPVREIYRFDLPLPGAWRFDVEGLPSDECRTRIEARQLSDLAVVLVQPTPSEIIPQIDEPPYYDPLNPIPYKLELRTDEGMPLSPVPDFPLDIQLTLTLPSGATKLPNGNPIQPVKLYPAADNKSWHSMDVPVISPEVGRYTLSVTGSTRYANPSLAGQSYEVFSLSAFYNVVAVKDLRFSILEPTDGTVTGCNAIRGQSLVVERIPVRVRLENEEGEAVKPSNYLLSDPGQSFSAVLSVSGGDEIEQVYLKADEDKPGEFYGYFLDNSDGQVVGCGDVSIAVNFVGTYDESRFRMPVKTQNVSLKRLFLNGVVASLAAFPNEKNLIHPEFCASEVLPVGMAVMLHDLNGQRLNPSDVALGDPVELYSFRLVGPDPTAYEDLSPTLEEWGNGWVLSVSGGMTVTTPGQYYFEVTANKDAFAPGYVPVDPATLHVAFSREDSLITSSRTCTTVKISGTALALATAALLVFAFTGGPGGTLIWDGGVEDEFGNVEMIPPIRLSRARIFSVKRGKKWSKYGIKSIKATKVRVPKDVASQPWEKRVRLEIVGINGDTIFDSELSNVEDYPTPVPGLGRDVQVQYQSGQTRSE